MLNSVTTLILIFLASFRKILISNSLVGHNWDFTFPYYLKNYLNFNNLSFYTWNQFNFGMVQNLTLVHLVPNFLYSLGFKIFGAVNTPKLLLFVVITLAFVGANKFISYFYGLKRLSYLPALFYAFSPFLFGEMIGGSWYMWISYAAIPWYVRYFNQYTKGQNKAIIMYLISSIFVLSSLQNFVLVELGLLANLLIEIYNSRKMFALKKYLIAHSLLLSINLYWVSVFLSSVVQFAQTVTSSTFSGGFASVINSGQSLINIFNLSGYWNRNFYLFAMPKSISNIFVITMLLVWMIIFYQITIRRKIGLKKTILLLLFLLSLLIVKGGNIPFSHLTTIFHQLTPLMSLYRSPQHLMLIPAIVFPLLISELLVHLSTKFNHNNIKIITITLLLLYTSGWWYGGDLGGDILYAKNMSFVDRYRLPNDILVSFARSEEEPSPHRVLSIPLAHSPIYLENTYQKKAQGGIPENLYLSNPVFTAEGNKTAQLIESALCTGDVNWLETIKHTNSLYVFVRNDMIPLSTPCSTKWNTNKVADLVASTSGLIRVLGGKNNTVYKVNEKIFSPLITWNGFGSVNFQKVNPTKYVVNIKNATSSGSVTFLENFNAYWRLFPKFNFGTYLFQKQLVAESGHYTVHGYANGWILDPKDICTSQLNLCTQSTNGAYDISFTIEYWPQRLFYFGLVISGLFLIGISFHSLIPTSKRRNAISKSKWKV